MLSFICSLQEQQLIRRRSGNRTGIDCAGGEDEGSGEPRSRRVELVLAIGWVLVLIKSVVVHWACEHYGVPFNAWWLIGPTLVFAALCTWLYWRRD
jgi:hypothetical protein